MLFAENMLNVTNENTESISNSFADTTPIMEMMIADEVSQLPDTKIQEFCAPGGVGEQLVQEGKLRKNTLVRLNKEDDLSRRTKMMAIQLSKEKNDKLFTLLKKNRIKERQLLSAIVKKYGAKARTLAKQGQNEWLHGPKPVLPKSFQKAGGDDR